MLPSLFAITADCSKPSVKSFNDFRDFASTSYAQKSVSLMSDKMNELHWKLLMPLETRPRKGPEQSCSYISSFLRLLPWMLVNISRVAKSSVHSCFQLQVVSAYDRSIEESLHMATRHVVSDKTYTKVSKAFGGICLIRIRRRVLKMPRITGCCRIIASPSSTGSLKGSRPWPSW